MADLPILPPDEPDVPDATLYGPMAESDQAGVYRGNATDLVPRTEPETADIPAAPPAPAPVPPAAPPRNAEGGTGTFPVDDPTRLNRFLILGAEGGSFYTEERELTLANAAAVARLIGAGYGPWIVAQVVAVSTAGRAAKQNPGLFVLAMTARLGDLETRRAAYAAVAQCCRIPTHLFTFIGYVEAIGATSGWGRGLRRCVSEWYNRGDAARLGHTVTKYRAREGWSHRDALRLAHVTPASPAHGLVLRYCAKGWDAVQDPELRSDPAAADAYALLAAVEEARGAEVPRLLELIAAHRLAREHLPTTALSSVPVWRALLEAPMPMTAMLRNLAKMTAIGLLVPLGDATKMVCARLYDKEALRKARVHPFSVLLALYTYKRGAGILGSLTWTPVPQIVAALDKAFHLSFGSVVPSGRRFVVAIDVSGSMGWSGVLGSPCITPRVAAAALALQLLRTEPEATPVAFAQGIVPLGIHARMSLAEAISAMEGLPFGCTYCDRPIQWAHETGVEADVFVVITDNETLGNPAKALRAYRSATGIPARLAVLAMTSGGFTIADPADAGMMDMAGFDASGPEILRQFAAGQL